MMFDWAKTVLSVYRYLEKVTNAIDKIVLKRAESAGFYYGDFYDFNNIHKITDSILELTERKIRLINLKLICEQALENTDPFCARLLISIFIDNRKCQDSAKELNISIRSYFRKSKQALASFASALNRLGFNEKYFEDMLKDENWILNLKEKLSNRDEDFQIDKKDFTFMYDDYASTSYNHQLHSSQIF